MRRIQIVSFLLALSIAGCGLLPSGPKPPGPNLPNPSGGNHDDLEDLAPECFNVKAVVGAEVHYGGLVVDIPADALPQDAEICIEVVELPNVLGDYAYRITPDQMQLAKPAQVTFDVGHPVGGLGDALVVAHQVDHLWYGDIATEVIGGDQVRGRINSLGRVAVVIDVVASLHHFSDQCAVDFLEFEACGGTLEGNYRLVDQCSPLESINTHALHCPDDMRHISKALFTGDATITASAITFSDANLHVHAERYTSDQCLAAVQQSCEEFCGEGWDAISHVGGQCNCSVADEYETPDQSQLTLTLQKEGDYLKLTDGKGKATYYSYCAQAGTLVLAAHQMKNNTTPAPDAYAHFLVLKASD